MVEAYLLKFNNLDFCFSSSELDEMDDFIKLIDGHLMGYKDKLHNIVIMPLFSPERKDKK